MIATKASSPMQYVSWTVSDTLVMTRRNLLRYVRLPQLLIFSTIQPVMLLEQPSMSSVLPLGGSAVQRTKGTPPRAPRAAAAIGSPA